jgi:hypothetical protein
MASLQSKEISGWLDCRVLCAVALVHGRVAMRWNNEEFKGKKNRGGKEDGGCGKNGRADKVEIDLSEFNRHIFGGKAGN